MPDGDVETMDKRGQWVNRVVGEPELSSSFSSKDEAVAAGESLAQQLGTNHIVHDAEPTGVITDPGVSVEEIVEDVKTEVKLGHVEDDVANVLEERLEDAGLRLRPETIDDLAEEIENDVSL